MSTNINSIHLSDDQLSQPGASSFSTPDASPFDISPLDASPFDMSPLDASTPAANLVDAGPLDIGFLENLANQFFHSETLSGLPQHYKDGPDRIPVSLAGSGASPSAIRHDNNINLSDPQTSFPDQNLSRPPSTAPRESASLTPGSAFPAHTSFPSGAGLSVGSLFHSDPFFQSGFPFGSPPSFGSNSPFGSPLSFGSDSPIGFPLSFGPDSPFGSSPSSFPAHPVSPESAPVPWGFDPYRIKKDFPILNERVNGKPLVWLDNAATTQKPRQVIDRISYFYEHENSNIHRAAHDLAARATDAYEQARKKIQVFLNAGSPNEIVFVRGATEAINLVAKSWGEQNLRTGDEIILSHLEHHANIVPWQQLAAKNGLKLRVIPVDDDGQLLLDEYAKLLGPRTKLVAFTQVSNALGTITPARTIIEMAHRSGAKVLLDGAQSVSHIRADVRELDADWFVFSGHKIFGPTGIGVLYGKEDLLNHTAPWQSGGNMIKNVTFEHTEFQDSPYRFEAGTGNIADAVGLGAAIDYVSKLGLQNIRLYEHFLLEYATRLLKEVPGLRLIGQAKEKTSVLSFVLEGYTNDQVGQALNKEGIAVRTGHHCAQPILKRFGLDSTVRPSLALYNTCADIDALIGALHKLKGA